MSTEVRRGDLFIGSCFALIATSVGFAVVGDILGTLKTEFVLSNEAVGWIGGARIWGFAISIVILGPLCNVLGMGNLLKFAILCHAAGTLVMVFANGFEMLFAGALILALGNGTIEAACNPLIMTLYPENKTVKLNQFHVWFPGGIAVGGILSFLIAQLNMDSIAGFSPWQVKLLLILIPTVIYAFLFLGHRFPQTERAQQGVSFGEMFKGAFTSPLFIVLLLCMCLTASLELGPGNWIPAVLQAGGIAGILVLAYGNGLVAVLRMFAGPVIHRLSPTGVLTISAILAGIGLVMFSYSETVAMAFISATVFYLGVCYFWPTMLGVVGERVPKSGELGLALMGGAGMMIVGLVTAPEMGRAADKYLHEKLVEQQARVVELLESVSEVYPTEAALVDEEIFRDEINNVVSGEGGVAALLAETASGDLPKGTANALRNAIANAPQSEAGKRLAGEITEVLNPADNYGGRMSFRYLAPFAIILVVVFGILFLTDKKSQPEANSAPEAPKD